MPGPIQTKMGMFNPSAFFKRQFRFLFTIDNIVGNPNANSLYVKPPLKSQRPSLSFKEITLEHLSETITMPGKAEWKPIQLTLYDIAGYKVNNQCQSAGNSVYDWINSFYQPYAGTYGFAGKNGATLQGFKRQAYLTMYDGSGSLLEQWQFDNAWCQDVNFNDVDMSGQDVMMIDMTLRYDRAYLIENDGKPIT